MYKMSWMMLAAVFALAGMTAVHGAEKDDPKPVAKPKPDEPKDEASAKAAFEKEYNEGVTAAMEKKWLVARQKLTLALRELGDLSHPKKSTAQVMLTKAERSLFKDDALGTADELFKIKQWAEAEEAFRKVAEITGDTQALIDKVNACRKGLEEENPELKKANDLLKEKKWDEASKAFNAVGEKLGMLRMIREGINIAQLNIEAKDLLDKAPGLLEKKQWSDAFDAYKRVGEILGTSKPDVAKQIANGMEQARNGYAEEERAKAELKAKNP